MARKNAKGKLTFLRVNEVGDRFGPTNDHIEAEVIIRLDSEPEGANSAFGFKLRNDSSQAVRQGMLDLLRDAFNHNWVVNIDYDIKAGKKKGIIVRVWLTKGTSPAIPGVGGVFK